MASVTQSPATAVNDTTAGDFSWGSPSSVYASDNARATANFPDSSVTTYFLKATNFGFNIPTDATIDGILLEVEASATSETIGTLSVKASKGGTISGDEMRDGGDTWTSTDTYFSYGSSTSLWGLTWTPADINNSGFGAGITAANVGGTQTGYIDHMRITVYYTEAEPSGPTIEGVQSIQGVSTITL